MICAMTALFANQINGYFEMKVQQLSRLCLGMPGHQCQDGGITHTMGPANNSCSSSQEVLLSATSCHIALQYTVVEVHVDVMVRC